MSRKIIQILYIQSFFWVQNHGCKNVIWCALLNYIHDSFINLEILGKTESSYLFYQSFRDYNWNAFGSESLKGKKMFVLMYI